METNATDDMPRYFSLDNNALSLEYLESIVEDAALASREGPTSLRTRQ